MKSCYFPSHYMFLTRYKTTLDKFSWLIQRMIPVFFIIGYTLNLSGIDIIYYIILYFISDSIFVTLYEIGYILNDVITAKNEQHPTIRLNTRQMNYLEKNLLKVILIKILIANGFGMFLYYIAKLMLIEINMIEFILILIMMLLGFLAHNIIRSRLNIITFIILVFCKFSYAIVLFVPYDQVLWPVIVSMLIFPVPRVIENICSEKFKFYKIKNLIGSFDVFRVVYLLFLLILTIILNETFKYDFSLLLYAGIYFILYRVASLFLVISKIHIR